MIEKSHPSILSIDAEAKENAILIHYTIIPTFNGELSITLTDGYRFPSIESPFCQFLVIGATIFLSQLCLADKVIIKSPCSKSLLTALNPTIENLYAVRAYREKTLIKRPDFELKNHINRLVPLERMTKNKNALLLWSGGLDSTLSYLLLKQNDYFVTPVHANINIDAKNSEKKSINDLSNYLQIKNLLAIDITFPQLQQIAKTYSLFAGTYPEINSVPHGRELLLIPSTSFLASSINASSICVGMENNAWSAQVTYQGNTFSRYDTQSETCNINLNDTMNDNVIKGMHLFSPIASFTDYHKFRYLALHYPEIVKKSSFCFWGNNCGRCEKCTLYYLYQESMNLELISFLDNPLYPPTPGINDALNNPDNERYSDILVCLAEMLNNGKEVTFLSVDEVKMLTKNEHVAQWKNNLLRYKQVKLLPNNFGLPNSAIAT